MKIKSTLIRLGKYLACLQAWLLLGLTYLLAGFFALIFKIFQKKYRTGWIVWNYPSETLEDLKRQY